MALHLSVLAIGLTLVASSAAFGPSPGIPTQQSASEHALLRLSADSGAVGHYKFTTRETHRLSYDIAPDDPRAQFLTSATQARQRNTEVALTMVTGEQDSEAERRYLVYWLGYRISGDEVRSLTALQWDSIFQKAGRRAVLKISPVGRPLGVEVGSEAVRPVGQALAGILGSMALALPVDSVAAGASWVGEVAVPVRRPDGTRVRAGLRVTYRLRRFVLEPEGETAHIEFDGAPMDMEAAEVESVSGRYFGEGVFAVKGGRYERMMAAAQLEVKWKDRGGLPPSRSQVEWQGEFSRR